MKFKLLLVLIMISICGCNKERNSSTSPLNYIPEEAGVIIKINNISQLKSELKNNTFVEGMSKSKAYASTIKQLRLLHHIVSDTSALMAFTTKEEDSTEFLLVLPPVKELINEEQFSESRAETVNFQGFTFEKRILGEWSFYHIFDSEHLLLASSPEVLVKAIETGKRGSPDDVLLSLFSISNPKKSAAFFVKSNAPQLLEKTIFKKDAEIGMEDYSRWISLDLDSRPDNLMLNGVSLASDSTRQFVKLFKEVGPLPSATALMAPATADAILSFSLADYDRFALNQKEYAGKSFVVDSLFNGVEEIGHIYREGQQAIVLHTYASEKISEFLENNRSGTSDYRGGEISTLEQNAFLNTFFNPLVKDFNARYYAVVDNAFVFSDNQRILQSIISAYNRKDTFNTSALFRTVDASLADESSILYVSNAQGLEQVWGDHLNSEFLRDFKSAKSSSFAYAGQVVSDDNFFHTNLVIKALGMTKASNTTSAMFAIQLDAEIATGPQFVLNHRTGKKEVVVQDVDHNLYLISTSGKVLWKKQLEGKIQGKISQVDIYKNGRLQLAFTTSDRFLILDRNGKEVKPFDMKFDGGNLNPLAVFDYDKNKNYRFVVTQGSKIFMYNSRGKIVTGFKYNEAESNILRAPKHLRIGQKDYLVFMLDNGSLKILTREGKTRVPVKERIDFSENQVQLYRNKFTLTDKAGTLFSIDQKGGISKTKLNLNEDHGIDATSKTLVTMNDNELSIKGKKVSLELGVYTQPKIFYIYDKIYVSVTDLQSQQTYLFDSNAISIPNFPVVGASIPDLADIDSDRKVELVTKESKNALVVYKMN
ncbi:MAG: ribonuclease HII [Flavobacteriaceae bacterium]